MNERDELENLLSDALPELPPDDIADFVNPWKRASTRVIAGLALTSITLNFLCLQYILPAVGTVLLLLGFRALRKENGYFAACRVLSVLRLLMLFVTLSLNATVLPREALLQTLAYAAMPVHFALLLCFWRGVEAVRRKAGTTEKDNAAVWLPIWYVVVCLLALARYQGLIVPLMMLAAYILILRSLYKLSGQIAAVGYAVRAADVRLSDRALGLIAAGVIAAGILCGYLFFSGYPMAWEPAVPAGAQTEEIRDQLHDLGVPDYVLDDLSADELEMLSGAVRAAVRSEQHRISEGSGRTVESQTGSPIRVLTENDRPELLVTGVAVELPGEGERWRVIHHFLWLSDPGFYGTECLQLWPASHLEQGWSMEGEVTGRLLYDRNGLTLTAPYASLGPVTWTADTVFWGEQTSTDIFASFSLPRSGEHKRGYLAYTVGEGQAGYIVDSWLNYTHQRSWAQYPVQTAAEMRRQGVFQSGVFYTVQTALQFFPGEDGVKMLS